MAIKVSVGEPKTQEEKPFPKLMKHKDGKLYFFYKSGCGLPLEEPKRFDECGDVLANWVVGWNMSKFTDYNEPITLQNA